MSALTVVNVDDCRRMKSDLQDLRRRGALRPSEDCPVGDASFRSCSRCRAGLGWIVNRGAVCQACRLRVCKACREYTVRTVDWVCTVCYKRSQIQTATGEWMNEFVKKPGQWKDNKFYMSAADIIKSTIRRSWTICDPNPRWPPSRDSPSFRPYNSLPRGRDVTDYPSLDRSRKLSPSPEPPLLPSNNSEDAETRSQGHSPRQRRVSQFERTLSELYGAQRRRRQSSSDETSIDRTSSDDQCLNNGLEIRKNSEARLSKQPSPRRKIQYTRSETSVISEMPRQQVRKQNSLQPKKYNSKERSTEDNSVQEKRVSFDDECGRNSTKSAIPKRDLKSRSHTKSESKSSDGENVKEKIHVNHDSIVIVETNPECDILNLKHAHIETITDTEKSDAEQPQVAGSVFRRVTIKKRRHDLKKTHAFDEGITRRKHRCSESGREELLDAETGKILLPDGDDYKLVFISSDSSSKEEDIDDNDTASTSSATTGHSFTIDDCDWDYFEPSSTVRPVLCWSDRNSPFGSPRVYRRSVVLDSPLGSPIVYRRARGRESDTGTDDDVTRIDSGSPVSSDSTAGFLTPMEVDQQSVSVVPAPTVGGNGLNNSTTTCQSCGSIAPTATPPPITQFVPIPVLVPIPVPVPAIWNPFDPVILYNSSADTLDGNLRARLRAIQQRTSALFWPGVSQASLISSLISAGGDGNTLLTVHSSVCSTAGEGDASKAETAHNMPAAEASEWNQHATGKCGDGHEPQHNNNDTNSAGSNADNKRRVTITTADSELINTTISSNNKNSKESLSDDKNKCDKYSASVSKEMSNEIAISGYLNSENTYVSSADSSDSSESDLDDEIRDNRPRIHRMYNVSGSNMRESDDALPSSDVDTDGDEDEIESISRSSKRNDDEYSSSGSADTDSDDTGTVADQKSRKFCKVFVVNNTHDSSSDIEDNTDSSSNTDTSDNDTDTEQDCVVLNYVRPIEEDSHSPVDNRIDDAIDSDKPVVLLKHVTNSELYDSDAFVNKIDQNLINDSSESVVLLKHTPKLIDIDINSDSDISKLSESSANEIDNNNFCETINNESENNTIVQEQNIDPINENPNHADNNHVKWRAENELSQQHENVGEESGVHATPALPSQSDRNAALIVEQSSPTTDCSSAARTTASASVSDESSKQTTILTDTIDLETQSAAPSPSDMKADPERLDVDGTTPPKTSINEQISEDGAADVRSPCASESASHDKRNTAAPVSLSLSMLSSCDEIFPQEEKSIAAATEQSEVSTSNGSNSTSTGSEWNTNAGIRSSDPVRLPTGDAAERSGEAAADSVRGARTGAPSPVDIETPRHAPAARYTSLVMITQESPAPAPRTSLYPQVSVVPSDTTTVLPATLADNDVVVQHTNCQNHDDKEGLAGYFTLALDSPVKQRTTTPRKPVIVTKTPVNNHSANNESVTVVTSAETRVLADSDPATADGVTVVTGGDTLSAVVCLEEGLADDDSWVEDISHDEDEFATTTATDSSSGEEVTLSCSVVDQEEELRGYHRSAIDFTLHTIVEESCEESEVEQSQVNNKKRPTSATDLEKYFFFRVGDGTVPNVNEDAFSETSSIYSEGMDSLGNSEDVTNDSVDPAELASSRLEKYFLSGFMGFTAERRDSDGSVGSDSEGRPSPEQRRKKLVRARGTGRSHSSSLDNLLANAELSGTEPQLSEAQQLGSENSSSSETDTYDEPISNFEKSDGQFDTVKRKKGKKQRVISGGSSSPHEEKKGLETTLEESSENKQSDGDEDGNKTPQPEFLPLTADLANSRKQQSRDSGFIGSCDDLLKEQKTHNDFSNSNDSLSVKTLELKNELEKIAEEKRAVDEKSDRAQNYSVPPTTTLTRKDSFNNWSSDEETNLMMSKMRQFFKTMVASNSNTTHINPSSKPTTPILGKQNLINPIPSPRTKNRNKPPQLIYFENELTRLMKTVPGIRDDQVREIVEYLSSEDTWSDSYDSSDYTSSDLEGAAVAHKSALQQQISASCQQIISKFDKNTEDEEGDEGDGGIIDESQGLNRETAFVYQKLVASFNKITTADNINNEINKQHSPHNSPPLIAKVMHHIGSRLVALMHEVSSGESHCSTSPKVRYHHRRLQQKLSSASTTTTEDDDSTSDSNIQEHLTGFEDETNYSMLPRSKSHDLLLGEARAHHQSSSGVSDIAEEREASDYERFSWRGSFESALMATDSRTKLSLLGAEGSASASALAMAAKRRSAGDLLFSPKSLSREQLDRVRSCGSIGGGSSEEKHWVVSPAVRPNRRRSSVPDATCGSGGSADGEDDDDEDMEGRSTLPRSLQTNTATTNSLPRLPTSATAANMHKAHSMHHFLQHNVKSARYRPPGFNRSSVGTNIGLGPKRAVSAPGLQPTHPRREARRRSQQTTVASDDVSIAESNSSPIVKPRSGSKSASPSPIHGNTLTRGTGSISSADWQQHTDDDIDRLVAMHQNRSSLSSLGLRSDSMASVYSGAGEGRYGIVVVKGQVEFGLQYNYKAGALEIHVKQCKDLAPVDIKRNRSDPYVKVYLLPDKSKSGKRKTKVKKHTLNPVFDECLKFHLSLSGLETRTLWLTVWHSDMFGRNDFLGEVMMPLENKVFDDPTPKWYNLQERTEPFEELPSYKGDVIVGLKFVPPDMTVQKKGKRSRGALHVLVKEAKNLTAVKANSTSDPFCKSYLLPDKGRSNKQKTPILRRTTNPVWNHTFIYDDVTLQELAERALELTVWDHDRLASNEFLGGVRFSLGTNKHYGKNVDWMDATGKELSLWQSMLERPNFWVEGCVTLRSSLDNRTS